MVATTLPKLIRKLGEMYVSKILNNVPSIGLGTLKGSEPLTLLLRMVAPNFTQLTGSISNLGMDKGFLFFKLGVAGI